jgi:hypothetical protein
MGAAARVNQNNARRAPPSINVAGQRTRDAKLKAGAHGNFLADAHADCIQYRIEVQKSRENWEMINSF